MLPARPRVDWTILRALSDVLGKDSAVRQPVRAAAPRSTAERPHSDDHRPHRLSGRSRRHCSGRHPCSGEIVYPIQDFYLTNPIARSSPTLQRCSAEILHGQTFAEAAE
jgi:NADH-quinone oxidoreductase subunit G